MEVIMATYSFINATKDALEAIRKAKTLSTVKSSNGNVIADLKFKEDEQQLPQEEYYPFKIFTDGDYIKVFPGDLELDYNAFSIQTPFGALSQQDQEQFNISGDFDDPIPISSFQNGDYVAAISLRKYQDGSLSGELFFFEDTSLEAHPNLNGFYSHSIGYVSISSQIIDNEQVKFVSDIRQWINTNIVDNYVPFENEFAISLIVDEDESQGEQIKDLFDFKPKGYFVNGGRITLNNLSGDFPDYYSQNIPEGANDNINIYLSYKKSNNSIAGSISAYVDDLPELQYDPINSVQIYNVKLGTISLNTWQINQQWTGGSIYTLPDSKTFLLTPDEVTISGHAVKDTVTDCLAYKLRSPDRPVGGGPIPQINDKNPRSFINYYINDGAPISNMGETLSTPSASLYMYGAWNFSGINGFSSSSWKTLTFKGPDSPAEPEWTPYGKVVYSIGDDTDQLVKDIIVPKEGDPITVDGNDDDKKIEIGIKPPNISGDNQFIFVDVVSGWNIGIRFDGSPFSRSITTTWDALTITNQSTGPSAGFDVLLAVDEDKIFDDFHIYGGSNVTVNGSLKSWTISVSDSDLNNWWNRHHGADEYKVKVGGNTDPMDPTLDTPGFLKDKLKVDPESPIGDLISLAAVSGDYYVQTPYNTAGLIGYNGTNFTKISLEIAPALSSILTIQEDYTNNKIIIGTNAPSTGNYALTCNNGRIQWTEMDECE